MSPTLGEVLNADEVPLIPPAPVLIPTPVDAAVRLVAADTAPLAMIAPAATDPRNIFADGEASDLPLFTGAVTQVRLVPVFSTMFIETNPCKSGTLNTREGMFRNTSSGRTMRPFAENCPSLTGHKDVML